MAVKHQARSWVRRFALVWLFSSSVAVLDAARAADSNTDAPSEELQSLSLRELADIQVTSVSKAPEQLRAAPAAIYVITQQDIQRSGVTTLADALRLAPNLNLTQMGSSRYALSARGFSTRPDAQA